MLHIHGYFDDNKLDLFRVSVGGKWRNWNYLVGGAYVDFAQTSDERRLHQYLIKSFHFENSISTSLRLGLEQRRFIEDDVLNFRGRLRGQLNSPLVSRFGIAAYDELFIALNGPNRFHQGLNENRLGFGLRYKSELFEVLLYRTFAYLKGLKSEANQNWIQLFTQFSF